MTTQAIQVSGLEKSYGELHVLRGVDLDVARGSIFALLGSNGAGKTTIVKILSTLLKPDAGTATVQGFDVGTQPADVRDSISLTGQFAAVDEILTGRENLVLVARLRHLADAGQIADDLLARFQLTDAGQRRVSTYSGGMRRRLDIAMSLIGDPPVIFLDEPTTGLDPQSRVEVWQSIKELAGKGTTVLLTTQYLDEAERLADRIAILHEGRIIAERHARRAEGAAAAGHRRVRREAADLGGDLPRHRRRPGPDGPCPGDLTHDQGTIMTTHALADTNVLLGRSMRHIARSPDTIITVAIMPIALMLLFVYVFGGAIDTGTEKYVNYLLPGILLITVATGISYTAIRLFTDMTSGIFERFQSMPIARSSVLWAHVLTSVVSCLISTGLVVLVALLMGFRTSAGVLAWLAVTGILALFTLALTWIAVIAGLSAKTMEGAGAFSYPIVFLPFISSAFVPTETMPAPVRAFAENQPVTAIVNTIHDLFAQQPVGTDIWVALAWCLGILVVAYAVAMATYHRKIS